MLKKIVLKQNFDSKYLKKCIFETKYLVSKKEYRKALKSKPSEKSVLILRSKKSNIIPQIDALQLLTLSASHKTIEKKTNLNLQSRFRFCQIDVQSFGLILKRLITQQPVTRFHKIKKIKLVDLINHKVAILKKLKKHKKSLALVARSGNSILAFHFAYLKTKKTLCLYELMTRKDILAKLAGLGILSHCIALFSNKINKLETNVYSHNEDACRLFLNLGMQTRSKVYYRVLN